MEDLVVPLGLFQQEFTLTDGFRAPRSGGGGGRSRGRGRRNAPARVATGPKSHGRIKKMVRDRGFGFIRGEDGKEVFFHRSGLGASDYDGLNEGDNVEYVVQEGPRGPRAENVRAVTAEPAPTA
ncbi:MAG: cold shock domain-containing protein [Deltaproteobacteria bacterium]|nr:cold shock domain-containing protein [Deltaproteobacteria bacterium]MBW2445420.1 cold shock domain-containing protein [Deltaproteobacteria bacterium]